MKLTMWPTRFYITTILWNYNDLDTHTRCSVNILISRVKYYEGDFWFYSGLINLFCNGYMYKYTYIYKFVFTTFLIRDTTYHMGN